MKDAFGDINEKLRRFVDDRDWGQFHSPKNLAMAMTVEVAELLEHFQWLTEEQSENLSPEKKVLLAEEIADIQIYLILMADKLEIDIHDSVKVKIRQNEKKYPTDKVRSNALKYNEYHDRQKNL
jgi:dCTP diphosphatase